LPDREPERRPHVSDELPSQPATRPADGLASALSYRPEIDGLRALAVLAVVLYHADIGVPGGFAGVDVFFVISGFLITSLIWTDLQSGKFTFAGFWERRARRIVPAMVAVTLATLAAAWFILLPIDYGKLGTAAASQAVFAANIYYLRHINYFTRAAEFHPLVHTWSLAVEEQFYMVVPFVLWALYRSGILRSRGVVAALVGTGCAAGLALSVHRVAHHPMPAFYLLSSRAWELLMGSFVAFVPASRGMLRLRTYREALSVIGLCAVVVSFALYSSQTRFPGLAAIPPCLGTALVIAANAPCGQGASTCIGAALSLRPVVFIGLISYSLYLWHWPMLVLGREFALKPLGVPQRLVLLGVAFALAAVSWKCVEQPFRRRVLGRSRRSMFAIAGAGLLAVLALGIACRRTGGFPQRYPRHAVELANAVNDKSFINEMSVADVAAGRLVAIGAAGAGSRRDVVVWGDSQAMAALPAVDRVLREVGWSGEAATHSATAPAIGWVSADSPWSLGEESEPFNRLVAQHIEGRRPKAVILAASWPGYVHSPRNAGRQFDTALAETVRRIAAAGAKPIVLLTVPHHQFDVPRALAQATLGRIDIRRWCAVPSSAERFDGIDGKTVEAIEAAGGRIVDPKPRFLDGTRRYYIVNLGNTVLYREGGHLSTRGAVLMLTPVIREALGLAGHPAGGPASEGRRSRAATPRGSPVPRR